MYSSADHLTNGAGDEERPLLLSSDTPNQHQHQHQHHNHQHDHDHIMHSPHALTYSEAHHLVHDIHEYGILKERLNWYTIYMFLLVLFIGMNVALLLANLHTQDYIETHFYLPFHLFSFWGVSVFTLVEAALLISTNQNNADDFDSSSTGPGLPGSCNSLLTIFISVCAAFVAAVLYSIDPETFEVTAHWVEYFVQFCMSIVNLLFVGSSGRRGGLALFGNDPAVAKMAAGLVICLSLLMMVLYAEVWRIGTMEGERAAHFVEFGTDALDGLFALLYAVSAFTDLRRRLQEHFDDHCGMDI